MFTKESIKKIFNKKTLREYFSNFILYRNKNEIIHGAVTLVFIASVWWIVTTSAPNIKEVPFTVEIEKGQSVKEIGEYLKKEGIIRSDTLFNSLIILASGNKKVVAGEYLFHSSPPLFELIHRVTRGDYGIDSKTIRIPEGAILLQIADLFEQEFPKFDKSAFLQLTEGEEGYLFPDTYTFLENVQAYEVFDTLTKTFNQKMLDVDIQKSKYTLEDIVIMASIIEKESTADGRQEVSNILWKRINIDMPLQVDATFVYERGKGTFDLTKADLKEDSPYNTYVNKGLPPTPIANPGLDSIRAAAFPEDTENVFFLTGRDGEMYYAADFAGHKKNRTEFLD